MISEEMTEVVVIGGGISGLSAAAVLQVRSILYCRIGASHMFLLILIGGRYPSYPTRGSPKAWGSNPQCRGRQQIGHATNLINNC